MAFIGLNGMSNWNKAIEQALDSRDFSVISSYHKDHVLKPLQLCMSVVLFLALAKFLIQVFSPQRPSKKPDFMNPDRGDRNRSGRTHDNFTGRNRR